MKHLKTFESVNNRFYFKITPEQYHIEGEKIINISDKAISIIKKYNIPGHIENVYYVNRSAGFIIELKDEWFIVSFELKKEDEFNSHRTWYLCDQLEGLDKCLDDVFDKNKIGFKGGNSW